MDHLCPFCDGTGRTRAPPEVQWAVQSLAAATIEHQMLRTLAEHFGQWVETNVLMWKLYEGVWNEPHPKVLATMAWNLRDKLKPFGLTIRGTHSHPSSYCLSAVEAQGGPQNEPDAIRLPDARQWLNTRPRGI